MFLQKSPFFSFIYHLAIIKTFPWDMRICLEDGKELFLFSTGDFRFVDQGGSQELVDVVGNNMELDCAVHSCKDVSVTW